MNTIDKSYMLKPFLWKLHRRLLQTCQAHRARFIGNMAELAAKALVLKEPRRVTFFGTDEFSVQSLSALHTELIKGLSVGELHVVTSRIKKGKTPVEAYSRAAGLPLYHWPVPVSDIPGSDLGVVVSFGHLLPPDIIEAFPLGVLNVHGSLLPAYRGAAPIIRAVMNGDTVTGVTVMRIHPHRFDVGEIVRQASVFVTPHATSGTLHETLAALGARLLLTVVRDLPRHYQLATPQPTTGVTNARKVSEKDGLVDWQRSTAALVYRQFLALDDHSPLWTKWRGQTLLLRGALWRDVKEPHAQVRSRDLLVEAHEAMDEKDPRLIGNEVVESSQDREDARSDDRIYKIEGDGSHNDSRNLPKPLSGQEVSSNLERVENKVVTVSDKRQSVRLKALNLFRSHVPQHLEPGQVTYLKKVNVLWVGCSEGVIGFTDIKPKGKKSMTPHDFFNGFLTKVPHEEWQFDK